MSLDSQKVSNLHVNTMPNKFWATGWYLDGWLEEVAGWEDGLGQTKIPQPLKISPKLYTMLSLWDRQFWDGRADNLEAQAQGPLQAKPEMAISKEMAVERISSMDGYRDEFKMAFGDDNITFKRIADAIGAFERTLRLQPSRI